MSLFNGSRWKTLAVAFLAWIAIILVLINLTGVEPGLIFSVDPFYLGLALLSFFIGLLVYAVSWIILLRSTGEKPHILTVLKSMMIGFFVDNVFPPVGPAGEITMGYVAHKEDDIDLMNSLASVTAQMFAWAIGFSMMALLVVYWVIYTTPINLAVLVGLVFLLVLFLLATSALGYFLFEPEKVKKLVMYLGLKVTYLIKRIGFLKQREIGEVEDTLSSYLDSFKGSAKPFLHRKKTLIISSFIMLAHHALVALTFYFTARGLGIETHISILFLFFVISLLLAWVSFIPGGLGVFEVSSISLISTTVASSTAILAIGVFRLIHYWSETFIGAFLAIEYEIEDIVETNQEIKDTGTHKNLEDK